MAIALVSFLLVFLLVAGGGLLLSHRQSMVQRITSAIDPVSAQKKTVRSVFKNTGASLGSLVEQFKHVLPTSEKEASATRARLDRAGFRGGSAVNLFNGSKVFTPLILLGVVLVSGLTKLNPFLPYLAALVLGFLLPDFWLDWRTKRRQKRIRRGLPDVLDMLVICAEAGLSMDQATARTASELAKAQPEICDELGIVVLEQRAGRARSDAWKQMADRTAVDSIRNLVSMLVQAEKFGTSVAKTMRSHADTLRVQRIQALEELAAKTSVKLVFPLVLFIFPSVFIVTLGPAIIQAMESFKN